MAVIKSKALVLLNEEMFKKDMFFLHVEIVPTRQANIILRNREKEGYNKSQIIVGVFPEIELRPGEKVHFSIEGALKLGEHQTSRDMFIVFDDKTKCFRQLHLEVNESNKSPVAFVKFTRGQQKKECIFQVMIQIGDYLAKINKPEESNDLGAQGTRKEHTVTIAGRPDSLTDNTAQPTSPKDSPEDLHHKMEKLELNIKPTEDSSDSESENTDQGSPKDNPPDLSDSSPYSKIISDKGLLVLATVMSPDDLWHVLISLGLSDDRIKHHHVDKHNHNVAKAGAAGLAEWKNKNKRKGVKELFNNLVKELEDIGRVDVAEILKTILQKNRYPIPADFKD